MTTCNEKTITCCTSKQNRRPQPFFLVWNNKLLVIIPIIVPASLGLVHFRRLRMLRFWTTRLSSQRLRFDWSRWWNSKLLHYALKQRCNTFRLRGYVLEIKFWRREARMIDINSFRLLFVLNLKRIRWFRQKTLLDRGQFLTKVHNVCSKRSKIPTFHRYLWMAENRKILTDTGKKTNFIGFCTVVMSVWM